MRVSRDSVVGCLGVAVLCLAGPVGASAHEKTAAELAAEDRAIDALAGRQNAIADRLTGYPGERRRARHDRRVQVTVRDDVIPLPAEGIAVIAPERPERPSREAQPPAPPEAPAQEAGEPYTWPVYVPYVLGGTRAVAPPAQPVPYQTVPNPAAPPVQPVPSQTGPNQAPAPVQPYQTIPYETVPYQTVPYQTAPPLEPVPYQTVPYQTVPPPAGQRGY